MKHTALSALLLLVGGGLNALAQPLHLSEGQSFSFEFETLQFLRPIVTPLPTPTTAATFLFTGDLLDPGDSVRVQFFGNSLTDTPFLTRDHMGSLSALELVSGGTSSAWNDLRGAVRFTVLSGSVDLSMLRLNAISDTPPNFGIYEQIFPVPEPSTVALLAMLSVPMALRLLRRHPKTQPC